MPLINLKRLFGCTLAALCLGLAPHPATAASEPVLSLRQLKHTAWGADRGAPSDIIEIAQSPDGFLWLATSQGLYRFDGVNFELIPPIPGDRTRSRTVYSLLAARNGDVWIGYYYGGIAVYRNGRLQDANPATPYGSANSIRQAPDGSIWLLRFGNRGSQLLQYKNGRWEDRSAIWDKTYPDSYDWFTFDGDGTIWIAATGVIQAVAADGRRRIFRMPRRALPQPDANGRMWIVTGIGAWPAEYAAALAGLPPGGTSEREIGWYVHVEPSGAVLMNDTHDGEGLRWIAPRRVSEISRSAREGQHETFDRVDGLTSEVAGPIFEDREHSIWVGTAGGLDQFRRVNLIRETPRSTSYAGGERFIRTSSGRVLAIGPRGLEDISEGLPAKRIYPVADIGAVSSMCSDRTGGLWLVWPERIRHWPDARPLPPLQGAGPGVQFAGCAVDAQDGLWASVNPLGIFRIDGGRWTPARPDPAVPSKRTTLFVADPEGGLFMALRPDGLYRVTGRGSTNLQTADALGLGVFRTILVRGGGVEIGGEGGITRVDPRGVTRLSATERPWLAGAASILHTTDGETWINAAKGIVRMRTRDYDAALRRPTAPTPYELFDAADGYQGSVSAFARYVTLQAPDGRLWFQTNTAWMWLDRTRVRRNALPPPVAIKSVTAQGKTYVARPNLMLPQGTRNLQIDYTALSLAVPEKVQFRYRLEGVDTGWVDPGQRRQAFYTKLPPGRHQFQVIAANNDGLWNTSGATLNFRIEPAFWQTWPFYLLLAVAASALLWLAYAFRVRQITERIQMRMAERLGERERIARDLHDTLLQGFQGLIMRFQAVAEQIPAAQPARAQLDQALDRADAVLVEGRERVRTLRAPEAGADLAELLESAAHRLRLDASVEVRLSTEGGPRPVHPVVCDEVVAIATEALFNAFRHAEPKVLQIYVAYRRAELCVIVRDDGQGFEPTVIESGKPGHYGLVGMAERARKIHGLLTVQNAEGGGGEVILTVPASTAYAKARRGAKLLTRESLE